MAPIYRFQKLINVALHCRRLDAIRVLLLQAATATQLVARNAAAPTKTSSRVRSTYSNTRYSLPFLRKASRSVTMLSCLSIRKILTSRNVVLRTISSSGHRVNLSMQLAANTFCLFEFFDSDDLLGFLYTREFKHSGIR